jgi:UDP:flavonoid glycosyltransferase YjiC (YdhE family)
VLCHGGHGTLMRALTSGAAVVVCPSSGDQYENAARVRWAKVGVSVPNRFVSSRSIRAAVEKLLARPATGERVAELAKWSSTHDAVASGADELEWYLSGRIPR